MRLSLRLIALAIVLSSPAIPATAQSPFSVNLDAVRQSVVFFHRVDASGQLKEAGTGFLLMVPTKSDPQRGYLLLVTARHIVDPQWAGCPASTDTLDVLFNKKGYDPKNDATGTVEVPLTGRWSFPVDDSVDIAVISLNGQVYSSMGVENQGMLISQLPSPEELKKVNSGSQIVSAGLLLGASGSKRNYPIFKFGYVSSIPEEKIAVACCPGCTSKLRTEWMIAASLVPGNSGSPIVFVPPTFQGGRAFLLGVQSTSFLGYDVAGMAPVQFLLDTIRNLNLPDANLAIPGTEVPVPQASPSSARPSAIAIPGPIPTGR